MFFTFPDQFVFWTEAESDAHGRLRDSILPLINEREQEFRSNKTIAQWDSKLSCSMGHQVDFLLTEEILNHVVWGPLDKMLSENTNQIHSLPLNSSLQSIWFNITNPGEYQEVHSHLPASFSGIYLLDCDEPNPTSFYRPSGRRESYTTFTTGFMKEGTTILFPSDLSHYVKPTKKRRVTLAFNVFCQYP